MAKTLPESRITRDVLETELLWELQCIAKGYCGGRCNRRICSCRK